MLAEIGCSHGRHTGRSEAVSPEVVFLRKAGDGPGSPVGTELDRSFGVVNQGAFLTSGIPIYTDYAIETSRQHLVLRAPGRGDAHDVPPVLLPAESGQGLPRTGLFRPETEVDDL
jgi:hypothetical protein